MDGSESENNSLSIAGKALAIVVAVFLVYFAVMSSLGRSRTVEELRANITYKPGPGEQFNTAVLIDSTYLSLLKEKSFLQSMNLVAATDSIYLVINLRDSTSSIGINGVSVHSSRISYIRISSLLTRGDRSMIFNMLSQPLTIDNEAATIRKEPLMEKIAPKDTSEYRADIVPDTTKIDQVHILLVMTNNTRIIISQEESGSRAESWSRFLFDLRIRLTETRAALKSVIGFKVPEYHPFILIRVPREDARIIYRALPVKGQIAVYT